jgi:hypothetical protein
MGSKELRGRDTWQDYSGANAAAAEKSFFEAFTYAFEGTCYRIRSKPNEFRNIYTGVQLSDQVISEIYNPPGSISRHGISPDYAIDNTDTNKTLYVEVKRQDGWVEGGKRADGRGNAHERSCKFFTPGLLEIMRIQGNIHQENALPFWTVFQGDITRDPCRVREITCWYKGFENHFFFWRNAKTPGPILIHFDNNLKQLLG